MSSNPWLDVTESGVYTRDPVSNRIGRSNWTGRADPASSRMLLDNRDGDWSPDNPTGPHHGQLTRNLPARIGVRSDGDAWVEWTEASTGKNVLSTPHDASLNITGDIDIRIEIEPTYDPIPVGEGGVWHRLASRSAGSAGWRLLLVDNNGLDLLFQWWDSGGGLETATYFDAAGASLDRSVLWTRSGLRVTLDVSSGEVEWFTAPSIAGTWQSRGTETVGATSIGSVSTALWVGGTDGASTIDGFRGRVFNFELRTGIGGTLVADLDLTAATPGAGSVVDGEGLTWTVADEGRISDTLWRVTGEAASWPVRWNLAGSDQWVPLEVNGLLRRLRQGQDSLYSPLRRGIIRERLSTAVVGYWPMEDKGDNHLQRMGPAIGTKVLVRFGGTPNPASNTDFLASDAIPTLADDVWVTHVDPYPATDQWMVRLLFSAPADGSGGGGGEVDFLEVVTTDLTYLVRYQGSGNGDFKVLAYRDGVSHYDSGWVDFNINGRPLRLALTIEQNGIFVDMALAAMDAGQSVVGGISDTIPQVAMAGAVRSIRLNKAGNAEEIAIGHLTVESVVRTGDLIDDLAAYSGETATARIRRLCLEEGVAYRIQGDMDEAARMGPQQIGTLADLLQSCADTDLGILYDAPDRAAVAYRAGATIRNQAGITFDYSAQELAGVPELDRDDQGFANDVEVVNWDGSEHRAQLLTGPSSVLPPPTGAGRYDTSYRISVADGGALVDHATARLALHSSDVPRISRLRIGLHYPDITPVLRAAVLAMRPGDRITIDGLPPLAHPGALGQIVQGWSETIRPREHWIDLVTTPAGPWDTGVIEDDTGLVVARYDTAGSELAAAATQGATSLSVATTSGPLWTTDGDDLPFDVTADGIRVTVTAISGASSPQTFTVTGATVIRDLASGGDVRLADPTYYAL